MSPISTLPVTRHRKGYIPDLPEHRTQKQGVALLRALAGTAGPARVPKSYSLEVFEAPIMDQGPTNSCTGHGTSMGLYTSFAAAGDPLGFVPSQRDIYALARIKGFRAPSDRLADVGAAPVFLMSGITEYGIRPMGLQVDGRMSDIGTNNVNDKPTLLELETDAVTIVTGEYRIDPNDPTAILQIAACISSGVSVGFGFQVDAPFEDWDPTKGPMTDYNPAAYQGGHWPVITSYDNFVAASPDATVLRGPNSWNRSWGSSGHFEVTGAWLKKTGIDIYPFVARRIPMISGAA